MPRRYGQFCPLAKALDVLGERWTLLIVRELLAGPKRYTDLRTELPGMATDLLATRLRELRANGVIARKETTRPTPAVVYELTERGAALRPVVRELSAWGRPLLAEAGDQYLPGSAVPFALEAAFRPEEASDLVETYALDVDGTQIAVRVRAGRLAVTPGRAADRPAVRITTDRQGFLDFVRGRPGRRVRLEGGPAAVARLRRLFGPGSAAARPRRRRSEPGGLAPGR